MYPFDIENALFVGIVGKEPGTPLFLPCFSQAVRATLRFQPGHFIDTERDGLHVARRPGWLVFRSFSGANRTVTIGRRGLKIGSSLSKPCNQFLSTRHFEPFAGDESIHASPLDTYRSGEFQPLDTRRAGNIEHRILPRRKIPRLERASFFP